MRTRKQRGCFLWPAKHAWSRWWRISNHKGLPVWLAQMRTKTVEGVPKSKTFCRVSSILVNFLQNKQNEIQCSILFLPKKGSQKKMIFYLQKFSFSGEKWTLIWELKTHDILLLHKQQTWGLWLTASEFLCRGLGISVWGDHQRKPVWGEEERSCRHRAGQSLKQPVSE